MKSLRILGFSACVVPGLSERRTHCSCESDWISISLVYFPVLLLCYTAAHGVRWYSAFPQHNLICCVSQDNYRLKSFLLSSCNAIRHKVLSVRDFNIHCSQILKFRWHPWPQLQVYDVGSYNEILLRTRNTDAIILCVAYMLFTRFPDGISIVDFRHVPPLSLSE